MAPRTTGRTTHVCAPARLSTLDTFLASDAPADLKAQVQEIMASLDQFCPTPGLLDEAALGTGHRALLRRMRFLSRAGLDLFRVLRGETPQFTTHSRQNVSASLRYERRKLGRDPAVSDYPRGHVVPLLAWAYYGSVAAWAAGAPGRQQKRKGHWRRRPNQLAAVQDAVTRFPGEPVTHALLGRAGYHALVVAIPAEELASLAAELGLERNLRYGSVEDWTAERCMDSYAALCQAHGVTLSCVALVKIGGPASSLRSRAKRHYPRFRAFQEAVAQRHPHVRLRPQFLARDGTVLDSQAEVVVHNALRHALPDVAIQVHVRLLATQKSCDMVLGTRVYVEVLGMARADMSEPHDPRKRQYARRWVAKAAIYAAMAVPLVVAEPDDVYDPARLTVCVAEVARLLDVTPVPPLVPVSSMRAKRDWTYEVLVERVREVADKVGGFPTLAQLAAAGYGHATVLLRKPGMCARVAAAIGYPLRHEKNIWSEARVVEELVDWVRAHGHYPSERERVAAGKPRMTGVVNRLFKGRQDALRDLVAEACGCVLERRWAAPGRYDTLAKLAIALRPLCDELGHLPRAAQIIARLSSTVHAQILRQIGMQGMAAYMGLPYVGRRRLTRAEALEEFRAALPLGMLDLCARIGTLPRLTTTRIMAIMGSRGIAMLLKHFRTIAALNAALAPGGRWQQDNDPAPPRAAKAG